MIEAGSDRLFHLNKLDWSENLGGEVGGELEGDRPGEAGGTLIPVLKVESGCDLPLRSEVRASSAPARSTSLGGESGGEFDAELFCDFEADLIDTGLRVAASVLLRGLLGPESRCGLGGKLACNNVSWSPTQEMLK